ncbi:hypothetical protein K2Z83_26050 [Oscillochloris sp. ZM17-4]|uniref:hypothetical protein n=1 Tax=Oscillochloris sp. ZM17-4 TaxID=2866714 RepID=UPI001C72D4DC|nr:hypothetical protein [Oscillochloris sp. ZM17-4]MBX0331116.1 hypothetical protein [Oscillochloris sp. ZM17-4]
MRHSTFHIQHSTLLALLIASALLAACGRLIESQPGPALPVATLMPTPTGAPPAEATAAPAQPPADSGWIDAAPGAELRRLRVALGEGIQAQLRVVRLDPALLRFEVGYAPDSPRVIGRWARDRGALAAINGGFFDEQGRTVSLLAQAGQVFGESYVGRGGMFSVSPDGALRLRGLRGVEMRR